MNEKNVPVWAMKPSPDLDWSEWVYPPLTVERLEQVLSEMYEVMRVGGIRADGTMNIWVNPSVRELLRGGRRLNRTVAVRQ